MEERFIGVLHGLSITPEVGYRGNDLLKGSPSLGDAGSIFTSFTCTDFFCLIFLSPIISDNMSLSLHDHSCADN